MAVKKNCWAGETTISSSFLKGLQRRFVFLAAFAMLIQALFIFCAAAVSVQVVFWLALWRAFARNKKADLTGAPAPVSVIVCAHDEEQNLKELLPLLLAQQHPQFEVIVVDDRSNDGTYDYLLQLTTQHAQVKMVRVQRTPDHINGKKYALTLGIKAARYSWVLLTDADCRPASSRWIAAMSAHFAPGKQLALGVSPYQRQPGLLNAFIRYETILTATQYTGLALLGNPFMGVGRNLAYQKDLFLANKGFHKHLGVTGGDDDLFVNCHATYSNTAIALGPDTLVFSAPKTTWRKFFRQKVRHLAAGKRYRAQHRWLLAAFSLSLMVSNFSLFTLLLPHGWQTILLLLLAMRLGLMLLVIRNASAQMGAPFEWWKVPYLDIIYAFYYLVAGPVALVSKKVRWTR